MSEIFKSLEQKHGLPPGLLDAVWATESGRGKNMVSPAGARGHFQFMPATAKQYGLTNPDDLNESAGAAARMYGDLMRKYGGDLPKALAAYNWGSGNVDRQGMDRAPAETRGYIQKITSKVQPKAQTMDFTQQIKQAKDAGYSDAEILGHLSQSPKHADKFKKAREAGYSDAEIAQHFGLTVGGQTAQTAAPEPSMMDGIKQGAGNVLAGAVRGAGSIGATVMRALPNALGGDTAEENAQRRTDMDAALQTMGAEPDSLLYKGGKLGAEIAGTAGAGGVIAKPLQALAATRYASGMEPVINGLAQAAKTGGFRVGELAGTGAGTAARVIGGAATGGASAALVEPSTAGTGAMIGGALPGAAQLAGKAGSGIRNAVTGGGASPEVAALAKRAQALGIQIPADRLVDSKPLNALSASLNYVPFSGRAGTEKRMVEQLDTALSRTFGQDSSNVTQALRRAGADLGGKFDEVLTKNTVKMTPAFKDALAEAENQATNELGPEAASIIHKQIAQLQTKGAMGEIDGQAAYNIKKALDRIGGGNSDAAFYARDLKKKLMEALNDSLGPQEAKAFAKVRQQYGNMLALENLAQNGAEGGISVGRLANLKNINNPDLQELADIAAQFVKTREAPHGAAQRVTLGGLAGGLSITNPAAIPLVAGAAGAGRLANTALNSNKLRQLVTNQGAKTVTPDEVNAITRLLSRSAPLIPAQ